MSDPGVPGATAAQYAWIDDWLGEVSGAYCLTLAHGLTPQDFLARIGALPEALPRRGLGPLAEASWQIWDRHQGERLLIGVAAVPGGWSLALEINGHLGVTPEIIVPLSAGTRVVSHYSNEAVDRFYYVEDRDIRLYFEPLFPAERDGSQPDALVEAMKQAGFELSEHDDDADDDDADDEDDIPTAASFALAEILTGVRLTAELLEDSNYLWGVALAPGL